MFLVQTFKNIFNIKLSDEKFSYLTQANLNDNIFVNNVLTATLNNVNEDVASNEDLLLLYNKDEVEVEFTLDSKN